MKQESLRIANYIIKEFSKENISFIEVKKDDGFKVTFADLGASIYEIHYKNKLMNLVPKYLSDFKRSNVYHGKTIGRVANRIKNAEIEIDSVKYKLDPNENGNTLHGGRNGLSTKYFEYKIYQNDRFLIVAFNYVSPHLEAGFPEELSVQISYVFPKDAKEDYFILETFAVSDRDTVVNLTNHTYFTLGESSTKNIEFDIYPKAYLETDENLLPIKRVPTKDIFKFDGDKGVYDEKLNSIFKLNKKPYIDNYFFFRMTKGMFSNVFLFSRQVELIISTNYPGVQVYSDNYKDDIEYKGTTLKASRAIAIEPSLPINDKCILKGEKEYRYTTYYEFKDID